MEAWEDHSSAEEQLLEINDSSKDPDNQIWDAQSFLNNDSWRIK